MRGQGLLEERYLVRRPGQQRELLQPAQPRECHIVLSIYY